MDYTQFVKAELLVLVPVLNLIGMWLKKAAFIGDKWIPLLLGGTGIFLSLVWVLGTEPISGARSVFTAIFTAFVQGVLCAGMAVYGNQIVKQAKR